MQQFNNAQFRMSDLEDLQKKMYQKIPGIEDRPESAFPPSRIPRADTAWQGSPAKSFFRRNIHILAVMFFVIAGGAGLLFYGANGFSMDNVVVEIFAPQKTSSVEIVEWNVTAANKNRVDIKDATIIFEYPENALPLEDAHLTGNTSRVSVGTIKARTNVGRVFRARLFGKEDEIKDVKVRFSFKPPGFSAALEKEFSSQIKIISSPLSLQFQGPKEVEPGEEASYSLIFKNFSDFDFPSTILRLEIPKGFTIKTVNPSLASSDTAWEISPFKIGQEERIEFTGVFEGASGEEKTLKAFLEFEKEEWDIVSLVEKLFTSKVVIAPIAFSLKMNGGDNFIAKLGDTVNVTYEYRNNANEEIKEMVIEGELVGEGVDVRNIETQGEFSVDRRKVRFDSSNTPELASVAGGGEGAVSLSFKVKDKLLIRSLSDKNFQIRLTGVASSQASGTAFQGSVPLAKAERIIPIATKIDLRQEGEYESGIFPSGGPIPPRVGSQTLYTVRWRLTNTSNDVHDFEIRSLLPSQVSFTGLKRVNFDAKGFKYDAKTREVIWVIDKLPATTGYALPVYEAVFQVALTPQSEDAGEIIPLLGEVRAKGVDAFTSEVIDVSYPSFATDLGGIVKDSKARVVN